jgi:hypothetical protein
MERTLPPPLLTTAALKHWRPLVAEQGHAPVAHPQLVSEVEAQAPKPKWFDGTLNGVLVLIGLTFFLYMWL